ncbi:N-Dimethylarginine dimethylaminohydrolase [Gracilibacillus ureilyticus]|uniref:N-Dimethylarginine dimethylaminohydrolase n=1 Tax=Gracilibacillus ureilyticus TaxID=531814 RepID=A0A1H9QCI6_9BACI|nr:arginine deiminase family protein [Gracilibacillus ureilyticus]SER58138.1 N-Dimethylarginine dimethylaminohydrolase [Gracilibacillus ureilyticus]
MISQKTEYGRLERVVVCPPTYMEIREIINTTQRVYEDDNIDVDRALAQHDNFVKTLKQNGVDVISLQPYKAFNEQVFTRDIGFTIDDTIFIAKMGRDIREEEVEILKAYLDKEEISYEMLTTPSIEGGDVIVSPEYVFVGVSTRTTLEAINSLQSKLPQKKVIPLPIRNDILHLDCTFNLISENEALIYSPGFTKEDVQWLRERFELIEVSEKEQFTLGTNVLSIGNKNIISLTENSEVNEELTKRGYQIIDVPFSEIIKSGGSFRCCSMPIERE